MMQTQAPELFNVGEKVAYVQGGLSTVAKVSNVTGDVVTVITAAGKHVVFKARKPEGIYTSIGAEIGAIKPDTITRLNSETSNKPTFSEFLHSHLKLKL